MWTNVLLKFAGKMERMMNLVGYDSSSQIMVVVVHRNNAQNLCVVLRHHLLTFSTDDETLLATFTGSLQPA